MEDLYPSAHDYKKSGARLIVEQLQSAEAEPFNDLDRYSIEDLILQVVTCDDRATREALGEGLRLKLANFEE